MSTSNPHELATAVGAVVQAAARVGLTLATLLAACEDVGCRDEVAYLRHMELIVREQRRGPIARALAQVGAASAMVAADKEVRR